MILPEAFAEKMRGLLNQEADDFIHALTQRPKISGLRCNLLKVRPFMSDDSTEVFARFYDITNRLDIFLSPVKWCPSGFTYPADTEFRPSKNPLYDAGLYYLQEPSAMAPVEILAPQPGERVLDLCAAPGGKAVQIAGYLQNKGVLIANDASATRSRALVKNLTLCGVRNAVILRETPEKLSTRFVEYFDKILVDAPCSGEGMFRKDIDAVRSWSENKPDACVALQREIIYYAAKMLKPGGFLVYSTCTFNTEENEGVIADFLERHPEFEPEVIDHELWGFDKGFDPVKGAARLWPHKIDGEGHFICKLKKLRSAGEKPVPNTAKGLEVLSSSPKVFNEFCHDHLKNKICGQFFCHGSALFAVPDGVVGLAGLRVARSGWYLGEIKKDRFEPSHALALGLSTDDVLVAAELDEEKCKRYLKGESLSLDSEELMTGKTDGSYNKAWVLVCIDGFPLGWGRWVNVRLKNKYPQGWVK